MASTSFSDDIGGLYKNMKVMAMNKIYGSSKDVTASEMSRQELEKQWEDCKKILFERDNEIGKLEEKMRMYEAQSEDQQKINASQKNAMTTFKKSYADRIAT